jgi:hypothetical protein
MYTIPIRMSPHTCETNQSERKDITSPDHHSSQATENPSHNPSSPSPYSNQSTNPTNASPLTPPSIPYPSDHMNWSSPSAPISPPDPRTSSSSDSEALDPSPKSSTLLPLPTSTPGYVTHAHQQAMAHRLTYDKLLPGGAFDLALYTPVFLHDTLMLPGSLASVLGKVRPRISTRKCNHSMNIQTNDAVPGLLPRHPRSPNPGSSPRFHCPAA